MKTSTAACGKELDALTRRMLDVSGDHVPQKTGDALEDQAGALSDLLTYVPFFTFGWIVFVPEDDGLLEEIEARGHTELARLLRFASERGFQYLKLDEAGGEIPGFPTFDC